MPKKPQVSVRGEIYEQVKTYCQEHGISVTDFVDGLCSEFFNPKPKPKPKPVDPRDARF